MQLEDLNPQFDELQKKFGDPEYNAIYGTGRIEKPKICFVFMNPTGKNISADPKWEGLRAPWIGTKSVWKLFHRLDLIGTKLLDQTQKMKANDWTTDFAQEVYSDLSQRGVYVTNLAKCTLSDARPLSNTVFQDYLLLMHQELYTLVPKVIISFGNQVSSILLQRSISVSKTRKIKFRIPVKDKQFSVYPVHYPVGQGMRNIEKSIEDIKWIMEN